MKILVINTGSSSLKYQLFDMQANPPVPLASGLAERIGDQTGILTYKKHPGAPGEQKIVQEGPLPDHEIALRRSIEFMTGPETGVIADVSDILAIGHRIVSGGEYFLKATVVEDWVEKGIEACIPLAPLHNPSHLVGIKVSQRLFPKALQVVVPDTAFHQTMPPEVFLYALPYKYYKEMHIRRYGAHGTSHLFVSKEAAKFLGKGPEEANLITLHLGNGSSITAVKDGKCLDTSMGMTPLAGVIMGSRTGDLDPAIPPFIMRQTGMSPEAVDDLMNKGSGFKGLCGSGGHARRAPPGRRRRRDGQAGPGHVRVPQQEIHRLLHGRDRQGGRPGVHRGHRRERHHCPGQDLRGPGAPGHHPGPGQERGSRARHPAHQHGRKPGGHPGGAHQRGIGNSQPDAGRVQEAGLIRRGRERPDPQPRLETTGGPNARSAPEERA